MKLFFKQNLIFNPPLAKNHSQPIFFARILSSTDDASNNLKNYFPSIIAFVIVVTHSNNKSSREGSECTKIQN